MQCRSRGSFPLLSSVSSSSTWASLLTPDTRMMLMSLSQQKACSSVKWICSAMSSSSSSSVARTHRTTLSGSLRGMSRGGGDRVHVSSALHININIIISEVKAAVLLWKMIRYLHIHEFGGLVHAHRETVLPLGHDQQLLQGRAHRLHPAQTHTHGLETWPTPVVTPETCTRTGLRTGSSPAPRVIVRHELKSRTFSRSSSVRSLPPESCWRQTDNPPGPE